MSKKKQQQNSESRSYSWLLDKGVYNRELQLEIAGSYAVENGFKWNKHYCEQYNRSEMFHFINCRWEQFTLYVYSEWSEYLSKYFGTKSR